jgi:hypothetical protein
MNAKEANSMRIPAKLADDDHPLVRETARRLIQNRETPREKLRALFYFVRDDIRFGYPKNGDIVKASETIHLGFGQCNNKATLLVALARAADFNARIHFSTINKDIQKGVFPGWVFKRMPDELSHSWVEVEVEARWRRIDSFINDVDFYRAGRAALRERGWKTGFSISCESSESDPEFNIDEERFVQMDAVTGDHGIYDEPADYYRSPGYLNRPGALTLLMYRLVVSLANRKVKRMRKECRTGLCVSSVQAVMTGEQI